MSAENTEGPPAPAPLIAPLEQRPCIYSTHRCSPRQQAFPTRLRIAAAASLTPGPQAHPLGRRQDETPYTVPELLHGRVFLLAVSGGSLRSYDDATLKAFVQMAKKHDVQLILH